MKKTDKRPRKNTVLSASEIGQYIYCSTSWYLQRCGYTPESESLQQGKTLHTELGETLDDLQKQIRRSRWYALIGLLILLLLSFILVAEVIL
ncbi:MAG: hypothetical protein V1726_00155 [Methanobacteriota archaeon]